MTRHMARKIGKKGSLTIPLSVRQQLNLEGQFLRIETNGEGQIILTPFTHACIFCGDTGKAKVVLEDKWVCPVCINKLKED